MGFKFGLMKAEERFNMHFKNIETIYIYHSSNKHQKIESKQNKDIKHGKLDNEINIGLNFWLSLKVYSSTTVE